MAGGGTMYRAPLRASAGDEDIVYELRDLFEKLALGNLDVEQK